MKTTEDGSIFLEQEEYENLLETFSTEQKEKWLQEHPDSATEYSISLYEINQQLINGFPNATEEQINDAKPRLIEWLLQNINEYYMLLCADESYFTVFHNRCEDMEYVADAVIDIIKDFSAVKVIEPDCNGAFAIWAILNNNEEEEIKLPTCFYLFPYDRGVVEV